MLVNETASDAERAITVFGRTVMVPVPAGRSRLVLFDSRGNVVAETGTE